MLDAILDKDVSALTSVRKSCLNLGLRVLEHHRLVLRLSELLIELSFLLEFAILREVLAVSFFEHVETRRANIGVERVLLARLLFLVEVVTRPKPL